MRLTFFADTDMIHLDYKGIFSTAGKQSDMCVSLAVYI